jgi:hypothetical protein
MINSAVAAVIGMALIVLFTIGLTQLRPPSGDTTIQPEGEPDPGKREGPGRPHQGAGLP